MQGANRQGLLWCLHILKVLDPSLIIRNLHSQYCCKEMENILYCYTDDIWILKACTHKANLPAADSRVFKILNMFDRGSQGIITESVVQSADSGIESADSTVDSATNPLKISLRVGAIKVKMKPLM